MIEAITSWAKNLIFLVLFAAFLELLLPSSTMQKFLRVIVGLLIMLAILKPVITVVEHNFEWKDVPVFQAAEIKNNPNGFKQEEENEKRQQLALGLYQKELTRQIEATTRSIKGVAAARAEVILDAVSGNKPGTIKKINLQIKPEMNVRESKIEIQVKKKTEALALNTELKNKILHMVCELYQISSEKIEINLWNKEEESRE